MDVKKWPIPSQEEIDEHEKNVVEFIVRNDIQLEAVGKPGWKRICTNLNPNYPTKSVYCMFNIGRKQDPKNNSPFLKLFDETHQQVEEKIKNHENIFFQNGVLRKSGIFVITEKISNSEKIVFTRQRG